jgi:hypothetical protein
VDFGWNRIVGTDCEKIINVVNSIELGVDSEI